jgi:sulfatase modifying factor 1
MCNHITTNRYERNEYRVIHWMVILGIAIVCCTCTSTKEGAATGWTYNDTEWGGFETVKPEYDTKYIPEGFVLIKGGTFVMGAPDGFDQQIITSRRVTLSSFLLSKYEVTNKEYREFVYWVRDSIAHASLGHILPSDSNRVRTGWLQPIDWSSEAVQFLFESDDQGKRVLNTAPLIYNGVNIYPDTTVWKKDFPERYDEAWAKHYFSNVKYDNYPVVGVSYNQASAYCIWKSYELNKGKPKEQWYPPVRLPTEAEWEYAAVALSEKEKKAEKLIITDRRRFPWNGEFYAPNKRTKTNIHCNSGGFRDTRYKHTVIDLDDDGYLYTAPVDAYRPNDFGLYQMAGNVSEWVADVNNTSGIEQNLSIYKQIVDIYKDIGYNVADTIFWKATHETKLNLFNIDYLPTYDMSVNDGLYEINRIERPDQLHKLTSPFLQGDESENRVIKGGSWLDTPYYLQVGARRAENPDSAKASIGFRTAMIVRMY